MAKEEAKNMPEKTFRAGKLLKASVWKNEVQGKYGKNEFYSIQLQTSWTEDDGKTFKNKDVSLSIDQIPKAIAVLQEAYKHCMISSE